MADGRHYKQLINFQGYQSFHSLRPINKRGGGISIFIKDSIRAKHLYRHSLSEDHKETLFVEINTGEITYIGPIYKPPSADCNVFIDSVQNILSTINQSKIYDLMLRRDFNIDLLNKDCNNSASFLNTMYSLSLLPIISKPTRITDNSATLINNFFINEPCNFESGILISDISDHFPNFFNRKNFFCTNSSKNVNKGVHYRLIIKTLCLHSMKC